MKVASIEEGGAMATQEPAMRPTDVPLLDVLNRATGPRRHEVDELLALFEAVSGHPPVVWANRIVGFGIYEYHDESGHGGKAPLLAFAPGAQRHTVYLAENFATLWPELVTELGQHRASKACLYFPRLSNIDRQLFKELLERSLEHTLNETAT